jgi:hypothetical protein
LSVTYRLMGIGRAHECTFTNDSSFVAQKLIA